MYVFDASPLVVLATAQRLGLLDTLDERRVVTERVYEEVVVVGRDRGYPDAQRIERAVDEGVVLVESVDEDSRFDDLSAVEGLPDADAATLALAAAEGSTAVMDETAGREVAAAEGIDTRGTAYLVLSLVRDGHLTVAEGRTVVDDLVEAGWYCSTDLYRRIQRKLDDLDGEA
jgi:predicted nucleic acid-binding protein